MGVCSAPLGVSLQIGKSLGLEADRGAEGLREVRPKEEGAEGGEEKKETRATLVDPLLLFVPLFVDRRDCFLCCLESFKGLVPSWRAVLVVFLTNP